MVRELSSPLAFKEILVQEIVPEPPFSFQGTFHKPSHFPTPIMTLENTTFRQTFRYKNKLYGLRICNQSTNLEPRLELALFANGTVHDSEMLDIVDEIKWRFGLDEDLDDFTHEAKHDSTLKQLLKNSLE